VKFLTILTSKSPLLFFDLSHASFVKSTSSLLRQLSITPVTQPDGAGHYASARGTG